MFAPERRMMDFLKKHILVIAVVVLAVVALVMRYKMCKIETADMQVFLLPWFNALRAGGIKAGLSVSTLNYNVFYLLMLRIVALFPFSAITSIKLVSILFDYLAAGAMAWVVLLLVPKQAKNRRLLAAGAFVGTLYLPLVFLNSALWGQCDVIYTFFSILSIVFVLKEKYTPAFTMLGLALCVKLQAIFILPVFIVLYCTGRRFSLLQFLQLPALVWLFGLVGLVADKGWFYGFSVYISQSNNNYGLYVYYPNMYLALQGAEYQVYASTGILLALMAFFAVLAFFIHKGWQIKGEVLLLFCAWSVLTCTHLLPSMHERYAFAGEMFLWLYFFVRPGWKRFAMAVAVNIPVLMMYLQVLEFTTIQISSQSLTLLNIVLYLVLSVVTMQKVRESNRSAPLPVATT